METVDQKLTNALDVESVVEDTDVIISPATIPAPTTGVPDQDMHVDMEISRTALHDLLKLQMQFVKDATEMAKERQFDARSVESVSVAMKEARDTALAAFGGIHKTRKEIEKMSGIANSGDTNITQNTVFVGTSGDLLRQMKELKSNSFLHDALTVIDVPPGKN